MKLENTLEALALQVYHSTDAILTDVRRGNYKASRQKWMDIQQAAWAALNELDHPSRMTEVRIKFGEVPLRVLLDQDGGMYVYPANGEQEITDLLLSSTLQRIEGYVKEALIELNTEDGQ